MTPLAPLTRPHLRRLREIYRSAGWPCQDALEIELLAAGALQRVCDAQGRDTLRVTDAGMALLAASLQKNRAAFDAHEALVQRVAREMQRAGRVVWCGLALRAKAGEEDDRALWRMAQPDVFSIRNTTRADFVEPIVHEIKVRRADLLSDLRHEAKRTAYLALSGECWYVLAPGIAKAEEIPADYGVLEAQPGALQCLRPAPRRAMTLPFGVWMALAKATPLPRDDDDAQGWLGDPADTDTS